jgi:DNA-binding CsgD family transcriptional regulator
VVLPRKVGRPVIAYPSRLTNTPYDCFAPAQVLIVFADLDARRQIDTQPLMDAFGLCASEARLTSLLAGGASIENAAESLGIAVNTARNQIKRVFEKTDTHSQGQLISLVSQLISPLTKP